MLCPATRVLVHEVEEKLDIFGTAFNRVQLIAQLITDGERVFAPAYWS